jgi:hypothetical protein
MSNPKQHMNHFFVDNRKYETESSTLSGAQIKQIAAVPPNYQLFLEAHGHDPDQQVSDGAGFTIGTPPLHFYSVPPATFGGK